MYKRNNVSLDMLIYQTRDLAEECEDARKIIDGYYCLYPYLKFHPELRSLAKLITMKAHEKSKEDDASYGFGVHVLILPPAIQFFAKDAGTWCPEIPRYQFQKMNEKLRGEKDKRVLERYSLEMESLGLLYIPKTLQTPIAVS